MSFPRTLPEGGTTLPGVANVVAVSSAKGGVGKSTVAVNLALALARDGTRVGLLDADIYGPSLPLTMGVSRQPGLGPDDKMLPVHHRGVALMSIGFIAGDDAPVIWRGPMLAQALQSQDQFLAGSFLMFLSVLTVFGMFLSDLALAALDPRIRLGESGTR